MKTYPTSELTERERGLLRWEQAERAREFTGEPCAVPRCSNPVRESGLCRTHEIYQERTLRLIEVASLRGDRTAVAIQESRALPD